MPIALPRDDQPFTDQQGRLTDTARRLLMRLNGGIAPALQQDAAPFVTPSTGVLTVEARQLLQRLNASGPGLPRESAAFVRDDGRLTTAGRHLLQRLNV